MKPSSSTGKYHPKDEHLPGGLTLHTCRVVDVVLLICNSRAFDVSRDEAIAAGIIHDVARFGLQVKPAEHSVNNHANQAAWLFTTVASLKDYGIDPEVGARVAQAIGSHMGRWGHPVPETPLDWTVHLADMVAAGYIPVKGEILK
jgi:HD superfamily phosphohydrolase YqeK